MNGNLSTNTKAILLLTAPLIAGRERQAVVPLTPGEYRRFATYLRSIGHEPADLLSSQAASLVEEARSIVGPDRLRSLLSRGFLLTQAVERWQVRAIWVVSRADSDYPQRLKFRLKEDSPAVIYGCGERQILDTGGLAVVGSRKVDDELIAYTEGIGRLAAASRRTLVSGGARGIDQAAMRGALQEGGMVTGVLADSLEKTVMNRDHRNALLEGKLVLVSPYDPSAGFNVGHAMQRNKLIYALSDAALVVNTDIEKGGTWSGATEQLKRYFLVPVYVRSTGKPSKGLDALQTIGARPWPNPSDATEFENALTAEAQSPPRVAEQNRIAFGAPTPSALSVRSTATHVSTAPRPQADPPASAETPDPASMLYETVRDLILGVLSEPMKSVEVAGVLQVTQRQAEVWLGRLLDQGLVEKTTRPVRYVRCSSGLFGNQEGVNP